MKRTGVLLVVLLAMLVMVTSCGLINPVKDTSWVFTETKGPYKGVGDWIYDYSNWNGGYLEDYTYNLKHDYTLSFTKDTVSLKYDFAKVASKDKYSGSTTATYSGAYAHDSGEITGTLTFGGESMAFTAIVEKDILTVTLTNAGVASAAMKFTKVKK